MTNSPENRIPASDSPTTPEVAPIGEVAEVEVGAVEAASAEVPAAVAPAPEVAPAEVPAADAPAVEAPRGEDAVLDADTYSSIVEPRSENRLPLGDGTWHQVSPKYLAVQLISHGALFVLIVVAVLVMWLGFEFRWALIPGSIGALITLAMLAVIPRQARSIGYQLRADDLVFRRGILWQRMVAVPYGRMQLVDITHGPLDRGFGIAQLKLVTAAAATGVTIPGLTQAAAERLRDTLIDVAETRRTGL